MIADLRETADGTLPRMARKMGLRVETHAAILGSRGGLRVTHALVARLWSDGRAGQARGDRLRRDRDERRLDAERAPVLAIARQAGVRRCDADVPAGRGRRKRRSASGPAAACSISRRRSRKARRQGPKPRARRRGQRRASRALFAASGGTLGVVAPMSDAELSKAFVDFQNDVTARDIRLATREGMRSIEHIKRYTTTGMATDQGKTSNMNALAIAAESLDKPIAEVGLTTFRLPYTPVTFGAVRRPRAAEHVRSRARDAAAFLVRRARSDLRRIRPLEARLARAACPAKAKEATIRRECLATRAAAGIMDASTLGKIEVVGPDAAEFLNRLYVNSFAKLGVGRCRYGLMLNEMGFIYDDGVVMRLAEDRFHITTTTSGAAHVAASMEDYLQTEWTGLKARFTSITEQFATIAINGPQARNIIAPLVTGVDLSPRGVPAFERARGFRLRRSDPAGARQLHRRTRLRGQRALGLRAQRVRGDLGGGGEARRRRLWHGGPVGASRREGLHHRRTGHRRHGHPRRYRHGQDGRDVEARFRRQALARAARSQATGPQAAGRLAQRRPRVHGPTRARRSSATPSPRLARPRSGTSLRPI